MTVVATTQATEKDDQPSSEHISPLSHELVVGVVGYAGAGCSTATRRLEVLLQEEGYEVHILKMSDLIVAATKDAQVPNVEGGNRAGPSRFERAHALQTLGDNLRAKHDNFAVASLAARKIRELRGGRKPGESKIAFVLDSIKHSAEVSLLREVYDRSFRLIAVHCERPTRETRLIGNSTATTKYAGVAQQDVIKHIDRDERDPDNDHGQQVRDAFYLGDFFIDNNGGSTDGAHLNSDLNRFINLVLGAGVVRPTMAERGMYSAHAAALQSSCLSRQVGASLVDQNGILISTGTNEVPSFGGGVYEEGDQPDHRCHTWEWKSEGGEGKLQFTGCHNQRKKQQLGRQIGEWLSETVAAKLAELAHPKPTDGGVDTARAAREKADESIRSYFKSDDSLFLKIPGIKDIVEYSRSIHAEMNALFNASRSGSRTNGASLFCTTYPCHNCARHMVTAGIAEVQYIEPYVKSLATELHYDSISTVRPEKKTSQRTSMVVVPFTGVGPRMYEDFFTKCDELKDDSGRYRPPSADVPKTAVRLLQLDDVEAKAAELVT